MPDRGCYAPGNMGGSMIRRSLLLAVAFCTAACGATAGGPGGTTAAAVDVPERVTDEAYPEALRTLHKLPFDHPSRDPLRNRVLAYLEEQTPAVVEAGDYDAVVEHLARMTSLYSPEDFAGDHSLTHKNSAYYDEVMRGTPDHVEPAYDGQIFEIEIPATEPVK